MLEDLGSSDAATAFKAEQALGTAPNETIARLAQAVQPAAPVDSEAIRRLISRLDAKAFAERQQVSAQLQALGSRARPALLGALEGSPSPELRRRVEALLQDLDWPQGPEELRGIRADQVGYGYGYGCGRQGHPAAPGSGHRAVWREFDDAVGSVAVDDPSSVDADQHEATLAATFLHCSDVAH